MSQILEKIYDCLTCKAQIKLSKKDSGNGWDKWNLDGSPHTHHTSKKGGAGQQQQQQLPPTRPQPQPPVAAASAAEPTPQVIVLPLDVQVAELADELREIKSYQKLILTHIQRIEEDLKNRGNDSC